MANNLPYSFLQIIHYSGRERSFPSLRFSVDILYLVISFYFQRSNTSSISCKTFSDFSRIVGILPLCPNPFLYHLSICCFWKALTNWIGTWQIFNWQVKWKREWEVSWHTGMSLDQIWAWIPMLSLTSCLTLNKLLLCSEFLFVLIKWECHLPCRAIVKFK